ncbi:rho GTPase-activating protein 27 isoform X3 [Alligator mississippiensis]|uniref:rho GTPase-activating protein 27 isoform X3 n=1 Tax=Alligator mississippiensis TaxID=8496 RepID=UPI00287807FD|nr:rho GTPase-activating protein 27 isoform X3 [Alligator mississippiensis]
MEPAGTPEDVHVLVEYGFQYMDKGGCFISIKPNERYILLKRTTDHWWHVKKNKDSKPFYIPAQYVKELPPITQPQNLYEHAAEESGQPSSGHTEESAVLEPTRASPEQPLQYKYKFVGTAQQTTNINEPSGLSGSVFLGSVMPAGKDTSLIGKTLPQVAEETKVSPPVLSSFQSARATKRTSCSPATNVLPVEYIRSAQSLDDLARVRPQARYSIGHVGSYRDGATAGFLGHPHALIKSHSENLYESIKDTERQKKKGPRPEARQPAQVRKEEKEKISAPVYVNIQELQQEAEAAAASTLPKQHLSSSLADWETHTDTDSGQLFYYNPVTGETTWDSPFENLEDGVSPATSPSPSLTNSPMLAEWCQHMDEASGQVFFYNSVTGETSWERPQAGDEPSSQEMYPAIAQYSPMDQRPPTPETDYPDLSPDEAEGYPEEDYSPVGSYEHGACHYFPTPRHSEDLSSPPGWHGQNNPEGQSFYPGTYALDTVSVPGHHRTASSGSNQDSPFAGCYNIIPALLVQKEEKFKSLDKAGVLNRTKVVDKGKRLRKNWSSSWTVLEGGILTFFKDSKHSSSSGLKHPAVLTTPEHTVGLLGATISWATKEKSSKKHVLELKTRDGSEYLIQHDSEAIIAPWQKAISETISQLSTDFSLEDVDETAADCAFKERLGSSEEKRTPGSGLSAGTTSSENDSNKVRNKLLKFLQRRPTLQSLRERGYIKDQVFGCSLQVLCERERGMVPKFVHQCIQTVENRGLDIDGLYRVSGNLATIQKLRYKVDHDEHLDLDDGRWEDVHVITGALKLFFRELPEPLFPFSHFDKFITAIKMYDPTKRIKCVRDLVYSLPLPNHDTMKALFRHLSRPGFLTEQHPM